VYLKDESEAKVAIREALANSRIDQQQSRRPQPKTIQAVRTQDSGVAPEPIARELPPFRFSDR
jgi:hypothetical protein